MKLWAVAFTIFMTCLQTMMSQGENVYSMSFLNGGDTVNFNFDETMFNRFYHCLLDKDYTLCDAQRNNEYEVITVKTCLPVSNSQKTDEFTCIPTVNSIVCKGVNFAQGVNDSECTETYDIRDDASLSQKVRVTWDGHIMVSQGYGIEISYTGDTFLITGTFIPKVTTTVATTTIKTTRRTRAPSQPSTIFPPDSSTITASMISSAGADKQESDDAEYNSMAIIIGAAVGGAVVIAIIVIIVVVLWRRKKRTSLSSKPGDGNYEDTDIYPYGDSTMSNIEPNLRPANLNTNSKEPTPVAYSTVDPNKKLNKSQTSSATNDSNKLKQKKPRLSQNLDYTEVDIDNDAGHYQSSSDVNNGQGVTNRVTISPSALPDPSAKPSYYNIRPETGQDRSATYSQVVKTNKNKDLRVINGDVEGSNLARDPRGYEEAALRTDTQYTTVDPSDKNTPNPATDGVYAKLHDPVRNITDVYNEWPATDNAGE